MKLLEHIRVKQAPGYWIVKNFGFGDQKLVNGSKHGDAKGTGII